MSAASDPACNRCIIFDTSFDTCEGCRHSSPLNCYMSNLEGTMHRKNQLVSSLGAALALSLAASNAASASLVAYDFSVTATDGPLSGTTEHGTFSYDSNSIVPGGGQNAAAGLLTALSFSWNGITYDQTTANTGFLEFGASGELDRAVFGTDCAAGCIVPVSTNAWAFNLSPPGGPFEFLYTLSGNPGLFDGRVTAALAVPAPEPSTLAILGIGCALVCAARRSRGNAQA
jgi:PEP-CTERM motif